MSEHKCLPSVMRKCPYGDRPVCTYQDGSQCEEENLAVIPPSILEELLAYRDIGLNPDELHLVLDPSGRGLTPRRLYELAKAEKASRLVVLPEGINKTVLTEELYELIGEREKAGDGGETYTTEYRYGHRNGRIELLRCIFGVSDGTAQEAEEALGKEEEHG